MPKDQCSAWWTDREISILRISQLPLLLHGFKDLVSEASKYRRVHIDFQWLLQSKSKTEIVWNNQVVPGSKKARQQQTLVLQKLSVLECIIQSISH